MKLEKRTNNSLSGKIIEILNKARQQVVQSVNRAMVYAYYEVGRMIVEEEQNGKERAEYGKQILKELSEELTAEFGKGFSVDNLENMRKFFLTYSQSLDKESEKSETVFRIFETPNFQLSWSHYLKLIRIDDKAERSFYEIEAKENNWSLRELKRQCDSALYQRLMLSRDKKGILALAEKGQVVEKPQDTLKDPYILEFIGLPESTKYSESELEQRLIDKIEHFLLELGKGFTFVGRQVRITIDEKHFRVDLVFYNRLLKSFVLIDLKIGELQHQDIGQMQMYVNYYDRFVRLPDENKSVGIILCQDKSETLVNITLPENNEQIYASKYQTVLPSKEELKKLIEKKG